MPDLINWELMKHPYNWLVVVLMLLIPIFAWHAIASRDMPDLIS